MLEIPSLLAAGTAPSPKPSAPDPAKFDAALVRAAERGPATAQVQRTTLSGDDARVALERAWSTRFGVPPSRETMAVLVAQWAHETGRGASMYNFNFGGIKGTGPTGLSVVQRTREGSGTSERVIVDRFRAYRTADEGAGDYLGLLDRRYPEALRAAEQGDAAGFVQGLRAKGYFTGDAGAYTRSVTSMARVALDQGFSALGAKASSAPLRIDGPRATSLPASIERRTDSAMHAVPVDTPFVSALALADELGRVAVKTLAQSDDAHERAHAWTSGA